MSEFTALHKIIQERENEITRLNEIMQGKDSLVRQLTNELVIQRECAEDAESDLKGAREALRLKMASMQTKANGDDKEKKRYAVSGVAQEEDDSEQIV